VTVQDDDAGPVKAQGNPIKLSAYDDPETRNSAPALDADRAAIIKLIGG
jgi:CoA:oxalate CoA-transferase